MSNQPHRSASLVLSEEELNVVLAACTALRARLNALMAETLDYRLTTAFDGVGQAMDTLAGIQNQADAALRKIQESDHVGD